ncbi:GRIP domain-containing protein [Daldinia caldariorum]|uniref:GRIP domain-containing protein n=1 Tax=Daldinia caldariorum TaxID=326644 RepID=UPI0020085D35|nr:GRIP domain-containing protein [Daldinia caldariorum]KAI1472155.1 GRIP domain-containing protein [Daldinia caldariorum]
MASGPVVIAEEQARQRALAEQRSTARSPSASGQRQRSVSRTNRTNSSARRKIRRASQNISNGDGPVNPDPAVFEAAFVLDDDDAEFTSAQPAESEKVVGGTSSGNEKEDSTVAKNEEKKDQAGGGEDVSPKAGASPAPAELPLHVKSKLRKLEKLEATYPELLRSYRIAHGRATSIEPFERALRENTPLTTIKDPTALVEYLNQLNLKGDMVMEEFKRVSTEKDNYKKKFEEAEKELATLRDEVATLKAARVEVPIRTDTTTQVESASEEKNGDVDIQQATSPSASKSPVSSILGVFSPKQNPAANDESKELSEDMFSYDEEIPQLQAEVASKSEEIAKLTSEINILKEELVVAKENSAGLVESLEKATRELNDSRDEAATREAVQAQLDARNAEVSSLTEKLEQTELTLRTLETNLEDEKSRAASAMKEHEAKLQASLSAKAESDEFEKLKEVKSELEVKIRDLTSEIDSLKKAKSESDEKIKELNKQIQSTSNQVLSSASDLPNTSTPTASGAATAETVEIGTSDRAQPSPLESPEVEALKVEDTQIEHLREEIENMQESLLDIGHDHVEAKERIKSLESEKAELKSRISELEKEIAASTSSSEASSKLQADYNSMKAEFDELRVKSQALHRYKDLTDLREVLSKVQPELRSLRQESATLKSTKEELTSKQAELRSLERREKDLKNEVARAQRLASDREAEIKLLNEKLAAEKSSRAKLEDEKRVAGRDYRRAEAEKIELSAKAEKAGRELESLQLELSTLRPQVKQLEDEVAKLNKEKVATREEMELKVQQFNNAQGLLSSMRDQTAELSIQLKEAQGQIESLEEEVAEVQKHLSERTREGETMRRMLADVDERADAKIRDMRARMEAAVEERDRIEDELSTLARRRARESEELKAKVREFERDIRTLSNEKDELEAREREWRRRREELEQVEEKATAEVDDLRAAVTSLRSALDTSEQQVREAEKQRADLRKLLDEAKGRYEKANKELKSIQARFSVGGTATNVAASSGRSSIDSTRSGTNGVAGSPAPDTMYLKTILLQFLEVKDENVRSQLVPVLGKLLRFDRNDEQKWLTAVQHLSRPGR